MIAQSDHAMSPPTLALRSECNPVNVAHVDPSLARGLRRQTVRDLVEMTACARRAIHARFRRHQGAFLRRSAIDRLLRQSADDLQPLNLTGEVALDDRGLRAYVLRCDPDDGIACIELFRIDVVRDPHGRYRGIESDAHPVLELSRHVLERLYQRLASTQLDAIRIELAAACQVHVLAPLAREAGLRAFLMPGSAGLFVVAMTESGPVAKTFIHRPGPRKSRRIAPLAFLLRKRLQSQTNDDRDQLERELRAYFRDQASRVQGSRYGEVMPSPEGLAFDDAAIELRNGLH